MDLIDLPTLPFILANRSPYVAIRLMGAIIGMVWFIPFLLIWAIIQVSIDIYRLFRDTVKGEK